MEKKRQDIVINVDPYMATTVIGMLRGYSRSIFDYVQDSLNQNNVRMKESLYDDIQEVLDEIYEKCIAQTDIRQRVSDFLETCELAGGVMPSEEAN